MSKNSRACPVGTLLGVRESVAVLGESHREFVGEMGMAATVTGTLSEGKMRVLVGIVYALGGVTLDRFRKALVAR